MKLKAYVGNYDGRREAVVAAPNQKEAARLLHRGLTDMRNFFFAHTDGPLFDMAAAEPGVVFLRSMARYDAPWERRERSKFETGTSAGEHFKNSERPNGENS